MITHDRWLNPCRSPTIRGSAVATIVWSIAASRVASMIAPNATSGERGGAGADAVLEADWTMQTVLPSDPAAGIRAGPGKIELRGGVVSRSMVAARSGREDA